MDGVTGTKGRICTIRGGVETRDTSDLRLTRYVKRIQK